VNKNGHIATPYPFFFFLPNKSESSIGSTTTFKDLGNNIRMSRYLL
jgi:hypothetical protein